MAIRTLGLCIEDPDLDLKQDQIKSRSVSATFTISWQITILHLTSRSPRTLNELPVMDSGYRRTSTGGRVNKEPKSPFPFGGLFPTLYLNHISFTQRQHPAFKSTYAGGSNPSLSLIINCVFPPFGNFLQNDTILFGLLSPAFFPSGSFGSNPFPLGHRHVPLMIKG